jgi:RimJ/RimL family protein N-acetyltransferase
MTGNIISGTLKNKTPFIIREIQPDDKEKIQCALKTLSRNSRFFRFHSPITRLSKHQLQYLTEIDYHDHYALCAAIIENGEEEGIGIARYIKLIKSADSAEFAIIVVDRYQYKGVGRMLLEALMEKARENRIVKFIGYVHETNERMFRLLKKYGCRTIGNNNNIHEVEILL